MRGGRVTPRKLSTNIKKVLTKGLENRPAIKNALKIATNEIKQKSVKLSEVKKNFMSNFRETASVITIAGWREAMV